ncbi:MAG: hypothetical protein U1E31_00415 [Rickettsiales bacterium]
MFKKTIICKTCYSEFLYPKILPNNNYILKCINCNSICKKSIINNFTNEDEDIKNIISKSNIFNKFINLLNLKIQNLIKYINYITCIILLLLQIILCISYFACINKNQDIFVMMLQKLSLKIHLFGILNYKILQIIIFKTLI